MKIALLGSGMMARGAAWYLLQQPQLEQLVACDASDAAAGDLARWCNDARVRPEVIDLADGPSVVKLLTSLDGAISCAHYSLNVDLTRWAAQSDCHMVDLGGNNDVVRAQLAMNDDVADRGITVVPDCGLAPGLASLVVAAGLQLRPWAHSVRVRVGGLPAMPQPPFEYERMFSVEGLINEYVEPPMLLRDGVSIVGEPLGDVEAIVGNWFPGIERLEAFNTSGGLSTMVTSFGDRLRNLDYKTLRYPGHAAAMRWMLNLGLFSDDVIDVSGQSVSPRAVVGRLLTDHLAACTDDRVLMLVQFDGDTDSEAVTLDERADRSTGLTAMMRTTAFPAAEVLLHAVAGDIRPGVCLQELDVDAASVLDRLSRAGISTTAVPGVR